MTGHLLACTVAAVAALCAVWALGRGPARWRYAILLAALLRFGFPTGWLDRAGRSLAPMLPAPNPPQALEDLRRLLLHPGSLAGLPAAPVHSAAPSFWLILWITGAAACWIAWARRLRLRPSAVRPPDAAESTAFEQARRSMAIARPVDLRIVGAEWVPGAIGLWRPAVALPEGLAAQLTGPELEAVLAHELAHILRRDNFWAAAAHAIAAAFWFHPLVWWIERHLLAEREAACDELVLRRGAAPETYLSGILKVCRMAFAGAAGYAGANGSNLEIRMERIMNLPRASRFERVMAGALMALATLFPLAGGYLRAQPQPQTLFDQGTRLLNEKRYDEAEQAFRRAYESDHSVRSLSAIAETEMAAGRSGEAVALMEEEAARDPQRRDLQMAFGNTAVRAGRYDLAAGVFQRMIADSPADSADTYLRLGETYRRMGNFPAAIDALRHAVDGKPDNAVAENTLALVLDASGQAAEAEQEYIKVLQLDRTNGVARNNLAYLYATHGGSLDEALDLAKDARLFLPQLPETADTLGYIYLVRKEAGNAFANFREAVLAYPANPEYRHHLLDALSQMKTPPANASVLSQALRAEPTTANQELVRGLLK